MHMHIYVCTDVNVHISKYIILKLVIQNKKLLALKNIEDIQNFVQTVKMVIHT